MDGAESDGSSTVYISTVGGIVMEQQRAWLQRYRQYPMAKMLRPLRAVRPALRAAWILLPIICCVDPLVMLRGVHHTPGVDTIDESSRDTTRPSPSQERG